MHNINGRFFGIHNALGARIADQAGFDGLWLSGLEVSASLGVPDMEIVSLTQMLELSRTITRVTKLPLIVDCDTGYGDTTNIQFAAREYLRAGVAGMCIEDKVFPKRNSFAGVAQVLEDPQTFALKIQAAKQEVGDDLAIVARTESLIAGQSVAQAMERAELYAQVGADAVLIHDKTASADAILQFAKQWDRRTALFAVPTTYYGTSYDALVASGISTVIYANQGLRSAITAVKDAARHIANTGSTANLEGKMASIAEIFDLQGADHAVASTSPVASGISR
jgi:phosphoenolpyruvate phosphomutase